MCAGNLVWLYIIICNETKTRKCVPYDVKNHIRIVYIWRWCTHKRKIYFERKSPGNDRNFRSGGYVYLPITRNCKEVWLSGHQPMYIFYLNKIKTFLLGVFIIRISLHRKYIVFINEILKHYKKYQANYYQYSHMVK